MQHDGQTGHGSPPPPAPVDPVAGLAEVPGGGGPDERRLGWQGVGIAGVAFVTSLLGAGFMAAVGLALSDRGPGEPQSFGQLALTSVGLWIGFAAVPLAASVLLRRGGPARDLGLRFRPVDLLLGIAAALCATVATAVLAGLVLDEAARERVDDLARDVINTGQGPTHAAALVVLLVVATPLAEEIYFRGLLFRSLSRATSAWIALPVSSVVFGVLHYAGGDVPAQGVAVQLGALVLFGGILAWLVHVTGRLGAAIVAHAAFNLVTVVAVLTSR